MEEKINMIKIDDPFYRYKMYKIKTESNNLKTVLLNVEKIEPSLNGYKTKDLLEFCSKSLNTYYRNKKDKWIIAGNFDNNKIQDIIYTFISTKLICKKCNLPEIYYKQKKCNSCGELF